MIDKQTVDKILDAAQIVDVVSDFVTLRKRGVNYIGLCPFHGEKTPSFNIYTEIGSFYCHIICSGKHSYLLSSVPFRAWQRMVHNNMRNTVFCCCGNIIPGKGGRAE